jgi:RimJ/RimL family protein N-acetyltransferase
MKTTMSFGGKAAPHDDKILKKLFHEWIVCNEILNETLSAVIMKENKFCGIFLVRKYGKFENDGFPKLLELGQFYKPEYHGSGIATVIGNKVIANCFENVYVNGVIGKIKSDNLGSQAVAIRCGFRFYDIYEENDTKINVYKLTKEKYLEKDNGKKDIKSTVTEYIHNSMQHALSCKSQLN